jgi:hypothetical protein
MIYAIIVLSTEDSNDPSKVILIAFFILSVPLMIKLTNKLLYDF